MSWSAFGKRLIAMQDYFFCDLDLHFGVHLGYYANNS